jgi:exosortase
MNHISFISFSFFLLALYFEPLTDFAGLALDGKLYSHVPMIPLVSLFLLTKRRKELFADIGYDVPIGILIGFVGFCFYWLGSSYVSQLVRQNYLALMMFSFIVCFNGGFIAFYGRRAFRKGLFPLLFLIFVVPFPTVVIEPLIKVLLTGSAETSYAVFRILEIPVYRQGFVFELPGIAVEVARQCSGINSTIALLITSVLAGHLFLRTGKRKIILILCIFPITIFKNSLRIVTISLLAAYVDPIFLTNHWIHSAGGKPFFILALLFLVPVLWVLRKSEKIKVC